VPSAFDDTSHYIKAALPKLTSRGKTTLPDVICPKSKINVFNLLTSLT